tara:strand:+ start:3988 stop:4944 length:957 start_codon:yes stop_codon:yes gene_type:complete
MIIKVCKVFKIFIFIIFSICYGQQISFMRFYANDHDYLSDNRLLATERFNKPYIQVFYNDNKVPIIREFIDLEENLVNKEIFEYKNEKILIRRYFLDSEQNPDSLIQYGIEEPWSLEFRKVIKDRTKNYFEGQESKFILNSSDQIQKIVFSNVQGFDYGEIKFIYNHLGLLKGEIWITLPNKTIIRRFLYDVDMLTGRKEIWEYGKNGQEISHVALTQPPASTLYKTPPPRIGNRLDEISIILEDIRSQDIDIPFDVFIPKTDFDLMVLTNTDSLMIDLLNIDSKRVTFKIIGDTSALTMPIFRVESITSKYGERIYP